MCCEGPHRCSIPLKKCPLYTELRYNPGEGPDIHCPHLNKHVPGVRYTDHAVCLYRFKKEHCNGSGDGASQSETVPNQESDAIPIILPDIDKSSKSKFAQMNLFKYCLKRDFKNVSLVVEYFEGFILHHNYFQTYDFLGGKTPALVAKINTFYNSWSDLINLPTKTEIS